jgi:SAM-dependent methyltransferase
MARVRDAHEAARRLRDGETWPTMAADLRRMVPRWHFEMLADRGRNEGLLRAIAAQVKPGELVLDIGTGAGLTALAAARQGATVVTCEANPIVAELARRVVRANQLDDRVYVMNLPSTDLEVGTHLHRRADVLVAEVFDADLLGEGAVPTIDDARSRLLRPDARLIPKRATVWCQLMQSSDLYGLNRVGLVDGFDLSAFNMVATEGVMFASVRHGEWAPLCSPARLFELDFAQPAYPAQGVVEAIIGIPGTLHAAVVWFELDLGTCWIDNKPSSRSHWKQAVYVVDQREVSAGDRLTLVWSHDMHSLSLEVW